MHKIRTSLINAISSMLNLLVVSVISLVLSNAIIRAYGSEYNGINSTVTQLVNTLMLLEGGFTLASNVSLFKPYSEKKYDIVSDIFVSAERRFNKISLCVFVIGTIVAVLYPFAVDSTMPNWMISALIFTALIPACINLSVSMKYRALILAAQKEYIITNITMFSYLFGNATALILIKTGYSLLVARMGIMIGLIVNYFCIASYGKKMFPFINSKAEPNENMIKGAGNVFVLKITSMLYSSAPVVIISTLGSGGAILASVYAVYRGVFSAVNGVLSSISSAPRLSFGVLLAERENNKIKDVFLTYEFIVFIGISTVLCSTGLLFVPFMELYSQKLTDANYIDNALIVVMFLCAFFEIIHIPSGQIIQMNGSFKVSRKIQSIACVALTITLAISRAINSIYMVVSSVLLVAIILSALEIGYVCKHIVGRPLKLFIKYCLPSFILCSGSLILGLRSVVVLNSYWQFILVGLCTFFSSLILSIIVFYIIDKERVIAIKNVFLNIAKTYVGKC